MSKPAELVIGACKDLSDVLPGLEVTEGGEYDLLISDPVLALGLQRLSSSINDIPKPPNPFDSQTTFLGEGNIDPIPWLSPTREYADQYLKKYDEYAVAFVDYGETRASVSTSSHKKREKWYVEEKQEALAELNIETDRQLVITINGCVTEALTHQLAAYYLTTHGWFVSTDFLYLPPCGPGVPDIVAWKSPLTEALNNAGLVRDGALLEELAYLPLLDRDVSEEVPLISDDAPTETLVAEAKGQKRSLGEAYTQLKGYLAWGAFDSGYCVVPGFRGREQSGAGTLTFDSEGFELVIDENSHYESEQKPRFLEYMDTAARQAMLCGLPFSELLELATNSGANGIKTPYELAKRLRNIDSETIIDAVIASAQQHW